LYTTDIRKSWPSVRPGLFEICSAARDWNSEDVYAMCVSARAVCLLSSEDDGFIVVSESSDTLTGEKVLFIVAAYCKSGNANEKYMDDIEALARNVGATAIEAASVRRGIGRLEGAIVGADTAAVNSAHHQAVRTTGPDVVVNATASDGVIEGIEVPARRFCLGVQWHPEYEITPADTRLLLAFVDACRA
ncbi:MAG: gamma-glutamyl-gamma-aminobutyrate hydrolase family protein, partial [Alphaproteobacteria bacterium]